MMLPTKFQLINITGSGEDILLFTFPSSKNSIDLHKNTEFRSHISQRLETKFDPH